MNAILAADLRRLARSIPRSKLAGKRILVTGANGFLGRNIVGALALADRTYRSKASITAVSLHAPDPRWRANLRGTSVRFLTRDLARGFSLPGRYDVIFHAAGYAQPARFMDAPAATAAVNVAATRALLESARKSKGVFVFFSSVEVYGRVPPGHEAYAESKRRGEALCAQWARRHGVAARVARIFHTYGPGLPADDARVMSDFIRKALTRGRIDLQGDGRAVKTYGYVADAAAMILWIAFSGAEPVYDVGGRDRVSIAGLARRIGALCGASVHAPRRPALPRPARRGAVKPDLSKVLKNMRGFHFTPFPEGLRRTVAWSRQRL